MSQIARIVADQIARRGPLPFHDFMEIALYNPRAGYYESRGGGIGRSGDYYTSVSAGGLFGRLMACQFSHWMEEISDERLHWVEAGSHDGVLAADILAWIRAKRPALFERMEYWIIEPSAVRRRRQEMALKDLRAKARWAESLEALPQEGIAGVIFSNELFDAMPVHRLGWSARAQTWFEWGVTIEDAQFLWSRLPGGGGWDEVLAGVGLHPPVELQALLPDGYTIEYCPEAGRWWHAAAQRVRRGKLLTFDYGLAAEEFFEPERVAGTVRAFSRHRPAPDVLANPGEQDITAHVNFEQLKRAGEAAGLRTETMTTQERFLVSIAAAAAGKVRAHENDSSNPGVGWPAGELRQFQTLTRPEFLGRFRVLVQSR